MYNKNKLYLAIVWSSEMMKAVVCKHHFHIPLKMCFRKHIIIVVYYRACCDLG